MSSMPLETRSSTQREPSSQGTMAATEALILIFALLVGLWAVKIYRNDLKNCETS